MLKEAKDHLEEKETEGYLDKMEQKDQQVLKEMKDHVDKKEKLVNVGLRDNKESKEREGIREIMVKRGIKVTQEMGQVAREKEEKEAPKEVVAPKELKER